MHIVWAANAWIAMVAEDHWAVRLLLSKSMTPRTLIDQQKDTVGRCLKDACQPVSWNSALRSGPSVLLRGWVPAFLRLVPVSGSEKGYGWSKYQLSEESRSL